MNHSKFLIYFFVFQLLFIVKISHAAYILIPMDDTQKNHLKSYGIAYFAINQNITVDWLLNYRGGSFLIKENTVLQNECTVRGVSFTVIANVQANKIVQEISSPSVNMDVIRLEKSPKIAIYSPKTNQPWDDAMLSSTLIVWSKLSLCSCFPIISIPFNSTNS